MNTEIKKQFDMNNECYTLIKTIKIDEVYEGYEISLYQVVSNIENHTFYRLKSNSGHLGGVTFETLEEMNSFYNEWKNELSNRNFQKRNRTTNLTILNESK